MKKILSYIVIISLSLSLAYFIFSNSESKTPSGFAVASPSLVESYSFEDNLENSAANYSLREDNAKFAEGKIGRALKIENSEDYLVMNQGFIEEESDLTISFWVFPKTQTGSYQIILWEGQGDGNGFGPWDEAHLGLSENVDKVEFFMKGNGENLMLKSNITQGEWSHVALVLADLETSKSYARLYVDGELKDTESITSFLARNYTRSMRLGIPGSPEHRFNGLIDEFKIYKSVFTDTQIRELFLEGVICMENLDCGNSTSVSFCVGNSHCKNTTFSACFSPGKNSYCGFDSNSTCAPCSNSCVQGQCFTPSPEKPLETNETIEEEKVPSFFTKLKCRTFHPFGKEKYQLCLNK